MIGRPEKRILIGIGLLMAALILLLAYYNTSQLNRERTINVSVIIDAPSDYLRKGIEKAADDYNVDTRLVGSVADQTVAIMNELDNNADAIILRAQYPDSMQSYLTDTNLIISLITLDNQLQHSAIAAHLGTDEQRLIQSLADAIAERAAGQPCIIVKPAHASMLTTRRGLELEQLLQQRGIEYHIVDTYLDTIASNLQGVPAGALVCMDANTLQLLCENAREGDSVFGIGYNNGARQYLESGLIKALVLYSEYDMGYLSVKAAVQAVNGDITEAVELPVYLVDEGNMYQQPINQILFPIE